MRFNKFHISIFLRIIFIVLACGIFVFFINRDDNILTAGFTALFIVIQTIFLIRYVNRTNRELAEFLIHLQQEDTSIVVSKKNIEKTFKGLRHSFNKINEEIKRIKKENEQKTYYLNYVINNIRIGLIAFDSSGNVEFVNNQAKKFLNKKNTGINNIKKLDEEYVHIFTRQNPSESNVIKKIIDDDLYYLSFNSSGFKMDNKTIRLFTIHDVKQEIENSEIESWQKLTSFLTHEMMNSLTPITSLAHAIKRYLQNDNSLINQSEINDEVIEDIYENARIIENRGTNLLEFINNYRTIAKLPKPKFEKVEISELLENVVQLFDDEIKANKIKLIININTEESILLVDKSMIEQVMINLIKNSIESLAGKLDPQIEINFYIDENEKTKIQVIDNGKGISRDIIDDIFVPFFTTKEKGTGVGLSLSKQIMKLHKGSIQVDSELDTHTKFTLIF